MHERLRRLGPAGRLALAVVLAGNILVSPLGEVPALAAGGARVAGKGDMEEFLGTWRGTSTCVNRTIAPACKDETVVYEVRASEKPQAAILAADKIVDGQRVPMGELEFVYSDKEGCWRSELNTPRVHGVWCLAVEGSRLTGALRVLPQGAEVRKVEAVREPRP